jgi:hypothetical protein
MVVDDAGDSSHVPSIASGQPKLHARVLEQGILVRENFLQVEEQGRDPVGIPGIDRVTDSEKPHHVPRASRQCCDLNIAHLLCLPTTLKGT